MGREHRTLDGNAQAPETYTYGLLDAPGFTLDSAGNATFAGNVTVTGAVSAGSGLGTPNPYGIAGATLADPLMIQGNYASSSGLLIGGVAPLAAGPISALGTRLVTAGSGSSGQNKIGIYKLDGTLIDTTVDMSAILAGSAGFVDAALASGTYQHPGGAVYLMLLCHYSVADPHIGGSSVNTDKFPALNGVLPTIFDTGITSLPASLAPGTRQVNNAQFYLYAR